MLHEYHADCGDINTESLNKCREESGISIAFDEMLSKVEWDSMLTLTFNPRKGAVDRGSAGKCFGRFVRSLSKKLYGKKSRRKLIVAPFLEAGTAEALHIHALVKFGCETKLKEVMKRKAVAAHLWTNACDCCGDPKVHDASGTKWFVEILDPGDRKRLRNYVAKSCKSSSDSFIVEYAFFG